MEQMGDEVGDEHLRLNRPPDITSGSGFRPALTDALSGKAILGAPSEAFTQQPRARVFGQA